jgi:hypothetical protein
MENDEVIQSVLGRNQTANRMKTAPTFSGVIQQIDYENHPAFRDLQNENSYRYPDQEIEDFLSRIDARFELFSAFPVSEDESPETCKTIFDDLFLELKQKVRRPFAPSEELESLNLKLLEKAAVQLGENLYYERKRHSPKPSALTSQAQELASILSARGWTEINFTEDEKSGFAEIGKTALPKIKQIVEGSTTWRDCIPLDNDAEIHSYTKEVLKKHHIIEAVSIFKGVPMDLYYAAVNYSHPRQTWFRGCYSDIGLPEVNNTNYLHFDAGRYVVKMVIYLGDAGLDQGPFTVLQNSYDFKLSNARLSLHHAVDVTLLTEPWLSVANGDNYHRLLFKYGRRRLMQLPRAMRGTTHFGDDILNGSSESDLLLQNLKSFEGGTGLAVLFDGSRVVHKGSTCLKGDRLGLQVALIRKSMLPIPEKPSLIRRAGRKVKRTIRSFRQHV